MMLRRERLGIGGLYPTRNRHKDKMRLASFDIFDTTLLRRCGQPEEVWYRLASRLFPKEDDLQKAFVSWRKRAVGDTLADIYANIDSAFLSFAGKGVEEMMLEEETVEEDMLIPNPTVCKLIEQRRKEGYQITFISDMYLSSQFLRQVLESFGCCQAEDVVFVSCEHHARKDTGALYEVVRQALHPSEWLHYGDNLRSDVKMARRKGIRAVHINTSYNDVENACVQVSPAMAALSRRYRLEQEKDEFAGFAADFVVPAYLPYVIYVLREARRMGIRKLYFLSRDSYILLKAAQALSKETEGLELHYLFVSRRSLLLPYLCGEDEYAYLAASDHHTLVRIDTIDKRLRHLGTSREEMRIKFGIEFPYSKVNNIKEQEDFLQKVFHSDFTPLLQQRAQEQLCLLLDYFRQEGLFDGEACAAVDVGWLGTSRLMINHILRRVGAKDLHFFYYGVRRDVFPPSAGRYSTYFQAEELSTETTALLEHYYSASPYPSTIAYQKRENGEVIPVFADNKEFRHTPITQANQTAIEAIASTMQVQEEMDERMLRDWAKCTFACLGNPAMNLDITPLSKQSEFDDHTPFVKRLTLVELVRLLLLGDHITGYDRGSLRLTIPRCTLAPVWRIKKTTGKLRGYIYQRFLKPHLQ